MSVAIVVADDDPDIRRLIAFTLARRGYEVFEAGDGIEALELIRHHRPALAVLDVMMPALSGLQVTERLLDDPSLREMPVLLLSARGQAVEIEQGLNAGARGYMVKPFSPKTLARHVADLLSSGQGESPEGS